jgi:2-keto-4-pentenoate hydratase/2-oxohepta-3-ene-1,7-dioic acid hydratase in catechol pathway
MLNLVRFEKNDQHHWGIHYQHRIFQLNVACSTTKALLTLGRKEIKKLASQALNGQPVNADKLLSPITQDAKVLCQGANYRQHMIDSGMNPNEKNFNMFFTKGSASITSPQGDIVKPKKVKLLDYEVELTLVLAASTQKAVKVNKDNLSKFIAGICIGNDVSARDIQLPQMQFHKGKSYRTFCPLGPYLVLLDVDEFHYLNDLDLTLSVNGEIRQHDNTRNLVFKPAETLSEFSQVVNFEPGDVLMTGTPSGCALSLPSPLLVKLVSLLPEKRKWNLFNKIQSKRTQYLQQGDMLELSIKSSDGAIDLGKQTHVIREGA